MQHGGDAQLRTEPFPVAAEFQQGFASCSKQQVKASFGVLAAERVQLTGQSEDDVEEVGGQQALLAALQPTLRRQRLTLGAVAVAAGVVGRALEPAVRAHVQMPAQRSGAATNDVAQYSLLLGGEPLAPPQGLAVGADEVGQLVARTCASGAGRAPRPVHGERSAQRTGAAGPQCIQGTGGAGQLLLAQV